MIQNKQQIKLECIECGKLHAFLKRIRKCKYCGGKLVRVGQTKYLCINCKKEFWKLPKFKPNECRNGYTHKFIRKSSIIKDDKRK